MKIEQLLARRTDLSTFLVHLTRDHDDVNAKDRLISILRAKKIEARSPYGQAKGPLTRARRDANSQRCVCFTETPLEHVCLLTEEIDDRDFRFAPYGIGITKKQGRRWGVNPVWYIDITPGHTWLTESVNKLINEAIESGDFDNCPIARIAPFFEQMGSGSRRDGGGYRKEFWWEREWRHLGDFVLPKDFLVFCPEVDFDQIEGVIDESEEIYNYAVLDPTWSLEQSIAHLAGYSEEDRGPM